MGITVAALRAMDSIDEAVSKDVYRNRSNYRTALIQAPAVEINFYSVLIKNISKY